jgi:hypothetical protein
MIFIHDNGWYLKLYYSSWDENKILFNKINKKFECCIDESVLKSGEVAFWIENQKIEIEEKTENIDIILNKRRVDLR